MAARLDAQLNEQVEKFLGNQSKGLRVSGKKIAVSKIFDWFEEDFQAVGSVDSFIRRYRSKLPALPVKADMAYDWALNSTASDG